MWGKGGLNNIHNHFADEEIGIKKTSFNITQNIGRFKLELSIPILLLIPRVGEPQGIQMFFTWPKLQTGNICLETSPGKHHNFRSTN